MVKKRVCRICKMFVEHENENTGSICGEHSTAQLSEGWKGRVFITDAAQSMIAEKMGVKVKGEYAIKVQ